MSFLIDFPTLTMHTSLHYLKVQISVKMLATIASQISIPSSLLIFEIDFKSLFEEVFEPQHQTSWKIIDTIFSDSRLKNLGHFVVWTESKQVDNFQKERIGILEKILPKLFKQNTIWWGDLKPRIGMLFVMIYLD